MTTIEVILFSIKKEIDPAHAEQRMKSLDTILKTHEGFISRTIGITDHSSETENEFIKSKLPDTDQKIWMDMVIWDSMENAKKAAQSIMENEEALEIFSIIEVKSIQMLHLNTIHHYEN